MAVERQMSAVAAIEADWHSTELWQALEGMRIEPEGAALSFEARLARENGWSRGYARAVVHEYRRFLYLAATGEQAVTPSDEVDQAWHLHLAYTRHYWGVLCGEILKRPLHHGPTAGGEAEGARYRKQYSDTLGRYRKIFGEEPPAAIWPAPSDRFRGRQVRVDVSRYWLVPKALPGRGAVAAGSGLVAACSILTGADGGGGSVNFTTFMGAVLVMVLIVAVLASVKAARRKDDGSGGGCGGTGIDGGGCGEGGGGCGSGCGGGCGGCGG